jgi:hypothetical protein
MSDVQKENAFGQTTKTFQVDAPEIEVWKARALRAEHVEAALTKEIGRLRSIVRVNLLRHVPSATHAAINALLDGTAENPEDARMAANAVLKSIGDAESV